MKKAVAITKVTATAFCRVRELAENDFRFYVNSWGRDTARIDTD